MREKVFKVELCFSEADFDFDKLTEGYVASVLERRGLISQGIKATVTEVGIYPFE